MVFLCPNIHCGKVFKTGVGVSNHVRSRKCKGANAEAAVSAKRRHLENEEILEKPQAQSADENVQEQPHNQPGDFAIPEVREVSIKFVHESI